MDPGLVEEIKGRLGLVIGDEWKLVKILGLGASAAVYRAVNRQRRRVAVKVMHHRFLHSTIVKQRFFREHHILSQLAHPNVLKIFTTSEADEEECYIVMELLEGDTLAKMMSTLESPMSPEEVFTYMDPVLEVLKVCHDAGIIHRDLKPANIFLTDEGVIKLLDFGVARFHEDGVHLTRDGTALGTPAFMSPEQATGRLHALDARSDVFSVGATMHYLLSGKYLHEGRTGDETFVLAASTPAPSLAPRAPGLPAHIVHLVDRAVAWDPADRWQSAEVMLHHMLEAANTLNPSHTPMFGAERVSSLAAEATHDDVAISRLHEHLRDLFESLSGAASVMLERGAGSPEAHARLEESWALFEVASRDVGVLSFQVRPFGLIVEGASEPFFVDHAPLSHISYDLYVSGARSVSLHPELTPGALEQLVALMMLESDRDLPPEDDLGSLLWDLELPGLTVGFETELSLSSVQERGSFEQYTQLSHTTLSRLVGDERDRVQLLSMKGATRLAVLERVLEPDPDAPPRPDDLTGPIADEDLTRLLRAHSTQSERWAVRVAATLGDALGEAYGQGDHARLLAPLSELLSRMTRAAHPIDALALTCDVLLRAPDAHRRDALLGCHDARGFVLLLDALGVYHPDEALPPRARANLKTALRYTSPEHVGGLALAAHLRKGDPALGPAFRRALDAHMPGARDHLADALRAVPSHLAAPLFDFVLSSLALPAVAHSALHHHDRAVQVDVFERLVEARDPLLLERLPELAWSHSGPMRLRAFRLAASLKRAELVPALKERFVDVRFHRLSEQERAMNFELLRRLSPQAALEMAARLLLWQANPHNAAAQSSRVVAARFASIAFPGEPIARRALAAAAAADPWNPAALREVSSLALASHAGREASS